MQEIGVGPYDVHVSRLVESEDRGYRTEKKIIGHSGVNPGDVVKLGDGQSFVVGEESVKGRVVRLYDNEEAKGVPVIVRALDPRDLSLEGFGAFFSVRGREETVLLVQVRPVESGR